MNSILPPEVEQRLKIAVESIVRPVLVPWRRKVRLREELFAHLLGIWEQERPQAASDEAALHKCSARLGEPALLTQELQQNVTRLARWRAKYLDWLNPDCNETPVAYMSRFSLIFLVYCVFAIPLTLGLCVPFLGHRGLPRLPVGFLLSLFVFLFTWSASLVALMIHWEQSLRTKRWLSLGKLGWFSLSTLALGWLQAQAHEWTLSTSFVGSLLVCACVTLGIAFVAGWGWKREADLRRPWELLNLSQPVPTDLSS